MNEKTVKGHELYTYHLTFKSITNLVTATLVHLFFIFYIIIKRNFTEIIGF